MVFLVAFHEQGGPPIHDWGRRYVRQMAAMGKASMSQFA